MDHQGKPGGRFKNGRQTEQLIAMAFFPETPFCSPRLSDPLHRPAQHEQTTGGDPGPRHPAPPGVPTGPCKHTTQWVGYKVHLTETCEDDLPHLITHVDTTIGRAADSAASPKIHAALQQRDLLPATHIVDTGYLDAEL